MKASQIVPPYFGAAYYPEDWPLDQVKEDIRWMKKANMNVMRIGEFAWSRMEPREGQYDWDWLHDVVEQLGRAGIATILGTPTATPPSWLVQRYPEALFVSENGQVSQHGARRHVCPNNPLYRDHCTRIVTKMAQEFGRNPHVIGWQIDNELYPHHHRGCCCPVCHRLFQETMRTRYGTIQALNAAWCTTLWSQEYGSFSELPIPRVSTWHHPSLVTAWLQFQSDSYVAFAHHQAEILHRLARQPVGTDMMPLLGLSYHAIHAPLDLVQFNHYNTMDNLWQAAFWMDLCRPLKPRPFWNTETSPCWNGSTIAQGYREPGFCRANSWLPFALGGEANLYWLWRAHWAGQELMHGAVLSSCGRPLHIFEEVRKIGQGLRKAGPFIARTHPIPSGLALHYSTFAWNLFECQPISKGFQYCEAMLQSVYRPIHEAHYRPDLIDPAADLTPYRLILSPFLPALDEAGLRQRLLKWIRKGGVWVAGPFTDIRNLDAAKFTHAPYSSLETWAGVRVLWELPGEPHPFTARWTDGSEFQGSTWFDVYECHGSKPLAFYTDGPGRGKAALVEHKVGKGKILLLGTQLPYADYQKLLAYAATAAQVIPAAQAAPNLLVVPREGPAGKGGIAVELSNHPAEMNLTKPVRNLLTGKIHRSTLQLPPYGVAVYQEMGR